MAAIKVPYYKMQTGLLSGSNWQKYHGARGCVPIRTQIRVSKDRLLPDEVPPPSPPKPKPGVQQEKSLAANQAAQKTAPQKQVETKPVAEKKSSLPKEKQEEKDGEDEACENPPPFDMLDIPDTMDKLKFTVAAKVARKWFNGKKHIYNDQPKSVQPLDTDIVSLDWVLKFKEPRNHYNDLIKNEIYSENALELAIKKMREHVHNIFVDQLSMPNPDLDTMQYCRSDIREMHNAFQFQIRKVSSFDTMDGLTPTDLTAALANFSFMAAIANARIHCEKYFNYPKTGGRIFCCTAKITITHVYIYVKDNYSFNDIPGFKSSQYLGHWNHRGLILVPSGIVSDVLNRKDIDVEFGNSPIPDLGGFRYRPLPLNINGLDKPVDTRRGWFKKFRRDDVYYPVHNRDYNEWREKHNRGGDFMIYTKPRKIKLPKPIEFTLDEICRPLEN